MVYSVTEGEEKPLKYPLMFRSADLVLVNKVDLLEHLDFDLEQFLDNLDAVNPGVGRILTSARTGQGVDEWCGWLGRRLRKRSETLSRIHVYNRIRGTDILPPLLLVGDG